MKKIYLTPRIVIVRIKCSNMVAATTPNGQNMIDPNATVDPEYFESRRRHNNVWGDEEDDDYGSLY